MKYTFIFSFSATILTRQFLSTEGYAWIINGHIFIYVQFVHIKCFIAYLSNF